jgi:SPP1 gp7 family putative phage head morphogenesis protein
MAEPRLEALPFNEAIEAFRAKGYRETFDYAEMMGEEHAYAFTVAKAMQRDVLQDIRTAMDEAIANGQSLDTFRKNLRPTLEEKGWWGQKEMVDPLTGEERTVRLGSPRRLKTIYETNMRTAYASGHWEQVQRTKAVFPYLRYVSVMDGRERPEHRALHDTVKPVDDPFWDDHYPPNGWGCRCSVQQLTADDVKRMGLNVTDADPRLPDRTVRNKRTGEVMRVPRGIDPGFNYNVGKARMKALTPPPLDKPLAVPFAGPASAIPLPRSKQYDAKKLPAADLSSEEYVQSFLKSFDGKIGEPKIFTDVTGERLVISDDLFRDKRGEWKVTKSLRHQYLPMLADTIKDPDEVWLMWEEYPKGRKTLLRRYVSRYTVAGEEAPGFALFDTSAAGWIGITTFKADALAYLKKQRGGTLVYRRPDEK